MKVVKAAQPPRGLLRWAFRFPIQLYRLRLGRLLGGRLLLLHHIGRVSGKPRRIVLEVVEHGGDGSYVVVSGFGPKADWYRNVLANPDVTVQVGGRTVAATARPVPKEEAAQIMVRYGSAHPRLARYLFPRLMGLEINGSESDFREAGRHLPFVRFVPRG
ncbi:deazaflavin-dependent oxidoreductase (nitroreductase family) [Saccharomonospora amisosensis]|uniref:Deazaflavin-dependent oxidoreductase (Nitroreductase family) n=1 Tax=Saccharomonospora amisosensis TaxID=1128677 RepID=A0A7X5ZR43_9PSEU|nr:nitroreductase family deazaflavin-dependent oxidoreductase [Saccharomonospora amisosensis]NIJ12473.1 deazaflavin-dependent oxidoreductase (nitroreductase family) [Saccharomonospora amisosensis]